MVGAQATKQPRTPSRGLTLQMSEESSEEQLSRFKKSLRDQLNYDESAVEEPVNRMQTGIKVAVKVLDFAKMVPVLKEPCEAAQSVISLVCDHAGVASDMVEAARSMVDVLEMLDLGCEVIARLDDELSDEMAVVTTEVLQFEAPVKRYSESGWLLPPNTERIRYQ